MLYVLAASMQYTGIFDTLFNEHQHLKLELA
jgi:hypothetical protein